MVGTGQIIGGRRYISDNRWYWVQDSRQVVGGTGQRTGDIGYRSEDRW